MIVAFQPCHGRITFLPDDGAETLYQDPLLNDDALFFVHPIIPTVTRYVWPPTAALIL